MADAPTLITYVTEADLDALGSDARVEVVNGEIVEMSPVGEEHHLIAGNLYDILRPFAKSHQLGRVFMDGLIFILRPTEQGLRSARVPDVSFIRKAALPPERNIRRPLRIAPTLAIEVMSPDDKIEEVIAKVGEYLDAGTEQVWVVLPRTKEIQVYRHSEATVQIYHGSDTMDVAALFPGLSLSLAEIFDTSE